MTDRMPALYHHPSQCEPFLPGEHALEPLRAKAHALLQLAGQTTGRADVWQPELQSAC